MIFESISESDPNISKDSSKVDETEMQLVAESRGAHLEEINDRLQKENSKLRAQFDEALRSNSQIEELHQKIQSLTSNLIELKSQNEELKSHLALAIQANDDLTSKYEEEKEDMHGQRQNDKSHFQNEIDKVNKKLKVTIENHQTIVKQFESDKEKMNIELKTSQNLISRLLVGADHFFETHFKNPDDLVTFLNKPPLKVQETQDKFDISNSITVKNQQIARIEKKRKKLLVKLEEQRKENDQLKNEILNIQKDHCSQIQEYINKIEDLKNQMHEKEEEFAIIDVENKHKIEVLNAKIIALNNSSQSHANANLTNTTSSNLVKAVPLTSSTSPAIHNIVTPIISDIANSEKNNTKIIDLEGSLEEMTQINAELQQKLSESEEKILILYKKLNDIENDRNEAKRNYEKVKTDYSTLNSLHQNTMTELQTTRIALRSREDPQVIAAKKEKIKKLKEHIQDLEKKIQAKESQFNEQLAKCEENLQQSEKNNHSLRIENDRLKYEVTSLEDQIRSLKEDLGSKRIDQQMSFGAASNVGSTVFIPTPSPQVPKLAKKCQEKDDQDEFKKQLKKSLELNEQLQREKESFIISLSSLFSSKNATCATNLEEVIDSISLLKKENDALKSIVNHITDLFSFTPQYCHQNHLRVMPSYPIIDPCSLISQINELHSKIQKQKESMTKKSTLNGHLQKALSQMKDKVEALEDKLQAKHGECQKLSSNVTSLETKIAKMKRKIHSQKLQIANFAKIKEDNDATCSVQVDKLVCERRRIENSLRDQLCEMSNMLNEHQRQVQVLNEENINLKKTIRSQKASIVDLKLKIENSEKEMNEKEENIMNSANSQNSSLNKTIVDLQNQLQNSRKEIEKLTKQLACAHKKLIQMKTFCEDAKIEKEKMEKEIITLREQVDREKQIAETNARTQILKAQSEFMQQLDEQKGIFEKEKKKYFTFAADQFRQFFNPQDVIDEKSFKEVIVRAKDELAKRNNSSVC